MVLVMVAGALGWCMSISRIPQTLAPAMVAAIHSPLVFLFASNLILLVVGCFMEALAALLILIPILVPAAIGFGIDPVQFGLIMIFNLILGTIHPPIGVVLFVMARIAEVTLRADIPRDPAVAGAAADRAGRDHRLAAVDAVVAERGDGSKMTWKMKCTQ